MPKRLTPEEYKAFMDIKAHCQLWQERGVQRNLV